MDTSIVSRHQLIAPIARAFIGNKLWVVNKGLMKQMNQGEWCDISFWCSHAFYIEISLGMAKMVLYIVWISSSLDTECILPFLFLNKWTKKKHKTKQKGNKWKGPQLTVSSVLELDSGSIMDVVSLFEALFVLFVWSLSFGGLGVISLVSPGTHCISSSQLLVKASKHLFPELKQV